MKKDQFPDELFPDELFPEDIFWPMYEEDGSEKEHIGGRREQPGKKKLPRSKLIDDNRR